MAYQIQTAPADGFSIGRVFARSFGTIGAQPAQVLMIGLLFSGIPGALFNYVNARLAQSLASGVIPLSQYFLLLLLFGLLGTVLNAVQQGVLVRLTISSEAGQSIGIGTAMGLDNIPALAAAGLLMGAGTMLGYVAFFVPGVIIALMWLVVPSVLVDEQCGLLAAFGRSRALTKDARWSILGLLLILGLVLGAINFLIRRLLINYYGADAFAQLMLGHGVPIVYLVAQATIVGVVLTVSALVHTSVYVELRNWKHGTPADALAEIFA